MDLKKILGNLGCTALATQLPPFGAIAATAIKTALGLSEKTSNRKMVKAISTATPEQILKLKAADNEHKKTMKAMGIEILELEATERAVARGFAEKMGLETINALAFTNTVLVAVTIAGIGCLVYYDKLKTMDSVGVVLITLIVNKVFDKQEQIYNFFFGSSAGSKKKTDIMGK